MAAAAASAAGTAAVTPASVTSQNVTPYSGLSLSKLAAATASNNSAGSVGRSEKVGVPSVTSAPSLAKMAAARVQAQVHARAVASAVAAGGGVGAPLGHKDLDVVGLKHQVSKAVAIGGMDCEGAGVEQKSDTRRVSDV
jgi:hypothetical protein